MKFFDKYYFANLQAGAAIYGMKVDEDFIHNGIESQPFMLILLYICPICFLSCYEYCSFS